MAQFPLSRRTVLGATVLTLLARPGKAKATGKDFPPDFVWGVSTSAPQIEGAADIDGRKPSIWDEFAARPGRIAGNATPAVACDHYHRWQEDISLMRQLGVGAYRFSIAWPRVIPEGIGGANDKGWAFYERLVDGLLKAGITPMPCLYHWDLPAKLQDRGGWLNRDSAAWLTEYGTAAVRRLGDRVKHWFILNEATVHAIFGHGTGEHAPGIAGGDKGALTALHHQNLAQGSTLKALRSERPDLVLGTILTLQPSVPETSGAADRKAAILWDAVWNRVALDGLMRGAVPEILQDRMADIVKPDDLALVRQPIDVLGMNYYSRLTVRAAADGPLFGVGWGRARAEKFTGYGWPVQPAGLGEMLLELKRLYGNPPILITENGAAYDDRLTAGEVRDPDRIAFLADHVKVLRQAVAAGCNVKGYMAWSLLDNFEWCMGYSKRFGLIYVDFKDLRRIPKSSFAWFRNVAKSNGLG